MKILKEVNFGSTESVSSIGFDPTVNRYMVSTSSAANDGRLYYFDLMADPTLGLTMTTGPATRHRLRFVSRSGGLGGVRGRGLAVAGPARADDWPTPGLDAAHSRLAVERSGAAFTDGRWSFAPAGGAGALASPVLSDGYAVSATLDGTVSALRRRHGGARSGR